MMAVLFGLEAVMILVVILLVAATDGALFEGIPAIGYQALAGLIVFIVFAMFVMPIWAVFHYRRTGRSDRVSSDAQPPPSESR